MKVRKFIFLLISSLSISSHSLAKNKTINLATLNWKPYFAKDLKEEGYVTALVRKVVNKMGYKLNIDFLPWAQAMKLAESGARDGLLGAYFVEERTKVYFFSEHIAKDHQAIFKLKSSSELPNSYKTLNDLKSFSFGIARGHHISKEFDGANFLRKQQSNSHINTILKLSKNRVDLIAGGYEAILHDIKNHKKLKPLKIEVVALKPFLVENKMYIALSKKSKNFNEKFIKEFNKNLKAFQKDGTYEKILQDFGMK